MKWLCMKKRKNQMSLTDKYEKGFIDEDTVLEELSKTFIQWAGAYFDSKEEIEKIAKDHNASDEKYKKIEKKIQSGENYPEKSLDQMLLKMHTEDVQNIKEIINHINSVEIPGGYLVLEALDHCKKINHSKKFDYPEFIDLCLDVIKQSVDEHKADKAIKMLSENKNGIEIFLYICNTYKNFLTIKNVQNNMFLENGTVVYLNAKGEIVFDYFKEIIPLK